MEKINSKSGLIFLKNSFANFQLNGGFTVSFWVKLNKIDPEQHSSVLHFWRSYSGYDFEVGIKKEGIYVEVHNQSGEVTKILSENKLASKLYNIVVRFQFLNKGAWDIALFVNSSFDTSGNISSYEPFNEINVTVGKFKSLKSYKGFAGELYIYFYPLSKYEIQEHYEDGMNSFKSGSNLLIMNALRKDEAEHNRRLYATEKHIPEEALEDLAVNPNVFKTHKDDLTDTMLNDRVPINGQNTELNESQNKVEAIERLEEYIFLNPLSSRDLALLGNNYEWIVKVASVMATGNVNKEGTIELTRFMRILRFCKINLSFNVIWEVIQITKTGTEILDERDDKIRYKGVMYYYFWKIANDVVCDNQPLQQTNGKFQRVYTENISDTDDNLDQNFKQNNKEIKGENVEEQKEKVTIRMIQEKNEEVKSTENNTNQNLPQTDIAEQEKVSPEAKDQSLQENKVVATNIPVPGEIDNSSQEDQIEDDLPILDEDWNYGPFEVNIIRCWNCSNHFDYSRHSEDEYINEFNAIANDITERFPEANIIGNYDKPSYLEWFDIYIRGVGPVHKRDSQGRYFIFRKSKAKRFPNTKEIIDYLIILSLLYGSSGKLGKAQEDFKNNYGYLIPRPSGFVHDNPAVAPANIRKQPNMVKNVKPVGDRIMICKNWGWGREYQEDKNEKYSWTHHPGKYQFGSRHGLWPESWTWCRSEWESLGCRKGYHRGIPKEEFTRLCINHGEPNPDSIYPDSFCGKPFKEQQKKKEWQKSAQDKEDSQQWYIHSGYLKFNKKSGISAWTCWGEDKNAGPCTKWEHKFADFPEEEAKKYFYDRPLINVGTFASMKNVASEFEVYGKFWGVFRKTQNYIPKNPPEKPYISRDEQKKLDQLDQVCLHWACGKVFKGANNHIKACLWHTGRWDFGNSVKGWTNTSSDDLMWEPHWTCCRKDWNEKGCTKMKHRGVYLETYQEIKRKYEWPDVRAQVYFKKHISSLWRNKMNSQCGYDEETLLAKINQKEIYERRRLSINELEELCDYLRLNLLINSDDMSYHFKFQDVINRTAHDYIDDGNGYISKEKFIKWWFMTSDEVFHKYDVPINQVQEAAQIAK